MDLTLAEFFEGDGIEDIADSAGDAALEFLDEEAVALIGGIVGVVLVAEVIVEDIEDIFDFDLLGWAGEGVAADGAAHTANEASFAEGDEELFEVFEGDILALGDEVELEGLFFVVVEGEIDKGSDGILGAGGKFHWKNLVLRGISAASWGCVCRGGQGREEESIVS